MPIHFLYTAIGRGHPFYLDGIRACLSDQHVGQVDDVFSISGGIPRMGWETARFLYRKGSSAGTRHSVYTALRRSNNYNRPGSAMRIMGRDIVKRYAQNREPLTVAHPLLVGILRSRENLFYQHGEMIAPDESLVQGPHHVFAPLSRTADRFLQAGLPAARITVTGLCIEPELVQVAASCFKDRRIRLGSRQPLTVAFFSSGAEPLPHVRRIIAGVISLVRKGHNALVFPSANGPLQRLLIRALEQEQLAFARDPCSTPNTAKQASVRIMSFTARAEVARATAAHFPEFDCFVAPAHERSNWAMGLGLPQFILDPPIGTFAPLNRQLLLDAHTAFPLESIADAGKLGKRIEQLRDAGALTEAACHGWQQLDIDGFQHIAHVLAEQA